jgi:transposase
MVWAGIWIDGKSDIIFMERDPDAPKKGYSAKSYQNALLEGLIPIYEDWRYFQQDNARIHLTKGTPEFLKEHGIEYIDWPPHSPDLNPIEHIWAALKAKLYKLHPQARYLKRNDRDIAKLKVWLQEAWAAIDQGLIRKLILSLPRRMAAVRKARGFYTKY